MRKLLAIATIVILIGFSGCDGANKPALIQHNNECKCKLAPKRLIGDAKCDCEFCTCTKTDKCKNVVCPANAIEEK